MKNIWMRVCLALVVSVPVTVQAASESAAPAKEEKLFEEPLLTPQKLGSFLRECRAENEGDIPGIRKCYNEKVDALSEEIKKQQGDS